MADRREKLIKIAGSRFLWRVKWVVSRGVTEEEKNLLLKFAVMKGRLGTVEYLHKKGADIINTTFKYEGNLFQTAVSRSHWAVRPIFGRQWHRDESQKYKRGSFSY